MSRPQYEYYQAPQQRASVVNGGLIDFQDNSLQRQQEYVTPNQYMAAGYAQTPSVMAQTQAMYQPAQPGTQAMFQPAQQGTQAMFQPAQPGTQAMFQPAPPGNQAGYISGPPSFLHVNGVTYKPVEDHPMMTQDPRTVKPSCEPAVQAEPGIKTLSEDEFHHAISEHVQKKVESYMSKQHTRNHHPVKNSKGAKRGHVDEEQAAMRVQAVNASMRGQSKPAAWQAGVNKW